MTARVHVLPNPQLQTVFKDNVALAIAVSPGRDAQADLVLGVAIKEAVSIFRPPADEPLVGTRAYRIARAELRLTLAGASADRILGRTTR